MQTKSKSNHRSGFTLVEIMIVVGIIGLLASIAVPNFMKSRIKSQQVVCIANLRQLEGAKEAWALEEKKMQGASSSGSESEIDSFLRGGKAPICPGGGTYAYNAVGVAPACSLAATAGHTL